MLRLYFRTSLLLLVLIVARGVALYVSEEDNPATAITEICAREDPETVFACGERLSIEQVDQYALELIPGVSSVIAERFMALRDEIAAARGGTEREQLKAMQRVRGVGPATARRLLGYLDFGGRVAAAQDRLPRYAPFEP